MPVIVDACADAANAADGVGGVGIGLVYPIN